MEKIVRGEGVNFMNPGKKTNQNYYLSLVNLWGLVFHFLNVMHLSNYLNKY